ncbi:MAG: DeoR family transcriptional regulator [Candidatus Paceibacterota bacterium]
MDQFNYLNLKQKIKDNTKGQKIAAALYLVSGHLSDTDPLRNALRTHAVTLSISSHDGHKTDAAHAVEGLLNTAVIAGLISEKNASIISLELRHYVVHVSTEPDTISHLFTPVSDTQIMKPHNPANMSHKMSYTNRPVTINNPLKIPLVNENKSKRQDAILSFINERKSVAIKDIAALFSDTSEKTIQRELSALVASGKITKRGEKRWSIYLSVN